jgi:ubiquinol-cytochrome c reductase cytochrome b subunit
LIDGDGSIQLSNKGYPSLEIVMESRDIACLEIIVNKIGGKIEVKPGVNWVRYRLHNKQGIINLINRINGEVRNPIRLNQLEKICNKYNIPLIEPNVLTYDNA